MTNGCSGTPYAPHDESDVKAMLDAIGARSVEELFDIPGSVTFDGEFGIESHSEQEVRKDVRQRLSNNDNLIEFLGRNHYNHYVPAIVDDVSSRSEFLTSYTQYQPEVTQGFLQALFEYQSIIVELTGLDVANCSMYDAATALGEAATLAARTRQVDGNRVLVPESLTEKRHRVLTSYIQGTDLVVETYPSTDGNADLDALTDALSADVTMVYAESPTSRGTIEEHLSTIGTHTHDVDALFVFGSDLIALALLEEPANFGADVVVGDAGVLGLPASFGTGLGLFAADELLLRQIPGRLVGAATDSDGVRSYTLTLQTREQHIRRERATSNICTNQAWLALRTAVHVAALGTHGMAELAQSCVTAPRAVAARLDAIDGIRAPVHARHHFREFVAEVDRPADTVVAELIDHGIVVEAVGENEIQIAITETNMDKTDELVAAVTEVMT
ncbi:aminomethyl-transferring glycine dehydrogenase subunit GcvPA [Halocatena marina]|uniref:aminomethyl-transferring glycine dehydrogenase subunit GcvPA n=1 Tax=Halocatena marina TaxID=2934937 RepID=UPI00200EA4D6|nr:aminomethyl-transferring glycine dehydrogenase subunit GcvPA [Halocatena marina]